MSIKALRFCGAQAKAAARGWLLMTLLALTAMQQAQADTMVSSYLPNPNLLLTSAGEVRAIARQSDGKIIIGGSFGVINGVRRSNLARFNADNSLDTSWNVATDSPVNALAIDASDNLYVAGGFTQIGGVARNAVAKLTSGGVVDGNWNPAPNSLVGTLLLSGAQIYLGGSFGNVGGQPRTGVARVSSSGSGALDMSWNPAPNNSVNAILESGGNVYLGGAFSQVGGVARSRLAKVSASGTGALDMTWNPAPDFSVNALALDSSNALIVGGLFSNIGGLARRCLAKVDSAGTGAASSTWLPSAVSFGCSVRSLVADGNNGMLVVGLFNQLGGQTRNNAGRVLDAGTLDPNWNPDVQAQLYSSTASVVTLLLLPGGAAQIGGTFDTVGGSRNFATARLTAAGARDGAFTAGAETLGVIRTYTQDPLTAAVYVGGSFELANGTTVRRNLLKLAPDLTLDATWTAGVNQAVYTIVVDALQRVYVGGTFTASGATTRNRLARFDSTGVLDATWNPNANFDVRALAFNADFSALHIGGSFTQIGGQPRNRLARLATTGTGSPPDSWDPNANNGVFTLARRASDSSIYVGGAFTQLGGMARGFIGKVSSAGVVDPVWNPNADNWVTSLMVVPTSAFRGAPAAKQLPATDEVDFCGFMSHAGGNPINQAGAADADGAGTVDPNGVLVAGPTDSINVPQSDYVPGAPIPLYGSIPALAASGVIEKFIIAFLDPATGVVTPVEDPLRGAFGQSFSDLSAFLAVLGALASPPGRLHEADANQPTAIGGNYLFGGTQIDAQGQVTNLRAIVPKSTSIFANGFE